VVLVAWLLSGEIAKAEAQEVQCSGTQIDGPCGGAALNSECHETYAKIGPDAYAQCGMVEKCVTIGPMCKPALESCTQLVGYPKNKGESWNNIVTEANSRQSATYIKVIMGDTTDYWMPKTGKTIGQMIESDCDGMWSPDKSNWQAPECMGYHDGGSKTGWPKNNVPGDKRNYLTVWNAHGSSVVTQGCCSTSYEEEKTSSWKEDWTMWTCS